MRGQDKDFLQKLSNIIVQQQEPTQNYYSRPQGPLKQVKGGAVTNPMEFPKAPARRSPPKIEIQIQDTQPNVEGSDQPRQRTSIKAPILQKTPMSKGKYSSLNGIGNQDLLSTPRITKIKFMNFQPEQDMVSRISKDIQKSQAPMRPSMQKQIDEAAQERMKLNAVIKIQALYRRRKAIKQYKRILKTNRYRISVYNELVKTEKSYVDDLKCIQLIFINEIQKQGILTREEIQRCFLNINAIIELNENMLDALSKLPWHPNKEMIKPMLDYAPFFKIYFEYCNNYSKMSTQVEKFTKENAKFSALLKEVTRNPKLRNLGVESFLVKPVQRLPKYVLLLKDYIKHTSTDHIDYKNIEKALELFNKVNNENNKHMDRVLVNAKMFEIQKALGETNIKIVDPKRDFILEEPMTVFLRNQPKSVIVYFFSDLVLVTERELGQTLQQKLLASLNLSESSCVKALPDQQNFKNIFQLIGDNETVTFQAFDDSNKKRILQVIQTIIDNLLEKSEKRNEALQKHSKIPSNIRKKKWKIEVEVLGSEERQSTVSTYTVYVIEVGIESIVCKIFLRFSEFTDLQAIVKKQFSKVNLPQVSDKNWIGNHDSKVIEARKLQIANYLQTLLGSPDFYEAQKEKEVASVLKFMGLPSNFYELPTLLTQYEQQCQSEEEQLSQFDLQIRERAKTNQGKVDDSVRETTSGSIIERPSSMMRRDSIKMIQQGKHIPIIQGINMVDVDQVKRINEHLVQEQKWQNKTIVELPKPSDLEQNQKKEYKQSFVTEGPKRDDRNSRSMNRSSVGNRRVSATKLLQSTSVNKAPITAQQSSFTLCIKFPHCSMDQLITDESRAIEVAELVAGRIGLLQHYDFKFVDEKSGRYIQDDEILVSIFRKKDEKAGGILSKVKTVLGDKYIILFRKVLFLPKLLETYEYHQDNVRLRIVVAQLMGDILNLNKMTLTFKEYCTIAALEVFVYQIENQTKQLNFEMLSKYVPMTLLKATKKEIWVDNVQEILVKFKSDIENEVKGLPTEKQTNEMQVIVAYRVVMNMAQQIRLYGITLYPAENSTENRFSKQIPQQILIGVSIEGLHILEPKKKHIMKTFYAEHIDLFKVFTNEFQIEILESLDENQVFKFATPHSYQIYQLYEEYQQILFEIEVAQQ